MLTDRARTLRMQARRGATLVELLVAIGLASVVLGSATTSVLRQQRTASRVAALAGADVQLRAATALLPAELSQLAAGVGDLSAGEASDTALQFRSPVAASVACATAVGTAVLAPESAGVDGVAGSTSQPRAGDSLWWRADTSWRAARISAVALATAPCAAPLVVTGTGLLLSFGGTDTVATGSPIRVTRSARYGLYRSGDGTWQLGSREWSEATRRFAAPQPVAGPFLLRRGALRSLFRYFDASGMELPQVAGVVDVTRVARVRLVVIGLAAPPAFGRDSVRLDSVDVALQWPQSP